MTEDMSKPGEFPSVDQVVAMDEPAWLELVARLAYYQRAETMQIAVTTAKEIGVKQIVETGCIRGWAGDGQSTLIFAMLAARLGARFDTFDKSDVHTKKAIEWLGTFDVYVNWHQTDSVSGLGQFKEQTDFLYLDSYDYDVKDPLPCQIHQLAEIGAIYGNLAPKAAILLDDCILPKGGKSALSTQFLVERGWKIKIDKYQRLLVNYDLA